MLVFDGFGGVARPVIGGRNPQALGEAVRGAVWHGKTTARGGEERIDHALFDAGVGIKTFALDGPIIAGMGLCDEVDACVGASQRGSPGEVAPQPDVGKFILISGVGAQVGQHQALESVTFVAFRE